MSNRSAHRPSLLTTVLRLAAVAAVAAVLLWSLLYVDLVRAHRDPGAALARPSAGGAAADTGPTAPAPAPVTTRTS